MVSESGELITRAASSFPACIAGLENKSTAQRKRLKVSEQPAVGLEHPTRLLDLSRLRAQALMPN